MARSWLYLCLFVLCLTGCGDQEVLSIHPTPLILNVRFSVDHASPQYVEKYFTVPIEKALKKADHVTTTHALAVTNSGTVTVFFEDGVKFSEGEDIILSTLNSVKLPKKVQFKEFTELCGEDLSDGHLMHLAKVKGIDVHSVLDRVITVTEELPSDILPKSTFDNMFENDCNPPQHKAPLYVLED